jgi:hypothetical protein
VDRPGVQHQGGVAPLPRDRPVAVEPVSL